MSRANSIKALQHGRQCLLRILESFATKAHEVCVRPNAAAASGFMIAAGDEMLRHRSVHHVIMGPPDKDRLIREAELGHGQTECLAGGAGVQHCITRVHKHGLLRFVTSIRQKDCARMCGGIAETYVIRKEEP